MTIVADRSLTLNLKLEAKNLADLDRAFADIQERLAWPVPGELFGVRILHKEVVRGAAK